MQPKGGARQVKAPTSLHVACCATSGHVGLHARVHAK